MARRPIFVPNQNETYFVEVVPLEFKWYPGFSKSQTQKSIASLHEAAEKLGIYPVLEVSRRSMLPLGASLSAFNLLLKTPDGQKMSVECAYQGSKVFERDGPYHDLYEVSSPAAKKDARLRNSGKVTAFDFLGTEFPIEPKTAFYDWLYMTALSQMKPNPVEELMEFRGFSDIAFNPRVAINCQARAVALYVSLNRLVPSADDLLGDWDSYRDLLTNEKELSPTEKTAAQLSLPMENVSDSCIPHNSNRETDRAGKHRSEHR